MDGQSFSLSPGAIAVPLLACITLILDIPPLVWHIKNHNVAAAGLVSWIILNLFFGFINALIWPTDDVAGWWKGFILCDIEVKLVLASSVGIPGCLACIMKKLAAILDTSNTVLTPSSAQRWRQLIIDLFLCFGFPLYMVIIHYVVQPNRYYIYSIAGCVISFDASWPSVVLVWIWPPILSLLGVCYSGKKFLGGHAWTTFDSNIHQCWSLFG